MFFIDFLINNYPGLELRKSSLTHETNLGARHQKLTLQAITLPLN